MCGNEGKLTTPRVFVTVNLFIVFIDLYSRRGLYAYKTYKIVFTVFNVLSSNVFNEWQAITLKLSWSNFLQLYLLPSRQSTLLTRLRSFTCVPSDTRCSLTNCSFWIFVKCIWVMTVVSPDNLWPLTIFFCFYVQAWAFLLLFSFCCYCWLTAPHRQRTEFRSWVSDGNC